MRGVKRIANENRPANRPAVIVHDRKLPPDRIVRDQRVTVQSLRKYALAQRTRVTFVHLGEAGTRVSRLIGLNDECAQIGCIAIMMRIKRTVFGFNKSLGQSLKTLRPRDNLPPAQKRQVA